jgi:hypothetical protein
MSELVNTENSLAVFGKLGPSKGVVVKFIEGVHPALGDFGESCPLEQIPYPGWLKDKLLEHPKGCGFTFWRSHGGLPVSSPNVEMVINTLEKVRESGQYYIRLNWETSKRWQGMEQIVKESGTRIKIHEEVEGDDGNNNYIYKIRFAGYEEYEPSFSQIHSGLILQAFREALLNPVTEKAGFTIIRHSKSETDLSSQRKDSSPPKLLQRLLQPRR